MPPKLKPVQTTIISLTIPIVVVVGFLIILSLAYWLTPIGKSDRWKGYLSMVGFIGTIMALITFSLGYVNQSNQRLQAQVSTFASLVDNYIVRIEQQFANNKNLNRLYKQMNANDPGAQSLPDPPEITPQVLSDELHMANQILEAAESIGVQLFNLNPQGWTAAYFQGVVNRFQNYFQSEILQKRYIDTRSNYSPQLQYFVEQYLLKAAASHG